MKANRKFRDADNAVSAVIGVILMVAITVAIAATVYVYVSGMIGGGNEAAPAMAFTVNNADDAIMVASADSEIQWNDFSIKTDNAAATINGTAVGTTWTTIGNTLIAGGATATVGAGDSFTIAGATGAVTVTVRYDATNSLIGTWTVTV